jgi:hypothetical protein
MDNEKIKEVLFRVSTEVAAERRKSFYHWMGKDTFPFDYLVQLRRLGFKYRPLRYLPLDIPKFEIDKKEFLDWWDQEAIDVVRIAPDQVEPWSKDEHPKGTSSSWYKSTYKALDIYNDDTYVNKNDPGIPWANKFKSHPMFDRIIEQIRDTLPFEYIQKIYIWESTIDVVPHKDSDYFWDVPLQFRIMLNDDNDPMTEPTLYVADVDHKDINYIKLPEDTNAFVWSNGSQIHGSDHHGKRKHLICINHTIDIKKYEELMDRSIEKYKNQLNYKLDM